MYRRFPREPDRGAGRAGQHRRPLRLREVHPAALRRRADPADQRAGGAARCSRHRRPRRARRGLAGLRPLALSLAVGPGQRRDAAAPDHARPGRPRRSGCGRARRGWPAPGRGPLPVAALGRHAAAGRYRPRPRLRAGAAAHGRAVRLGGRADPGGSGRPGPAGPGRAGHHDPGRDPRHRRERLPWRPGNRADPGARPGSRGGGGEPAEPAGPDRDQGAGGVRPPPHRGLPAGPRPGRARGRVSSARSRIPRRRPARRQPPRRPAAARASPQCHVQVVSPGPPPSLPARRRRGRPRRAPGSRARW